MAARRIPARMLQLRRMRQLPQKLRVRCNLMSSSSSGLILTFESRLRSGPTSNVKIIKATGNMHLLVGLMIATFASAQAGSGCKRQNRTTGDSALKMPPKIYELQRYSEAHSALPEAVYGLSPRLCRNLRGFPDTGKWCQFGQRHCLSLPSTAIR